MSTFSWIGFIPSNVDKTLFDLSFAHRIIDKAVFPEPLDYPFIDLLTFQEYV